MTDLGDVDVLLRALDLLSADLAPSNRQRALSTLRGFCGWLVCRDHLSTNPCDAPELTVKRLRPEVGDETAINPVSGLVDGSSLSQRRSVGSER